MELNGNEDADVPSGVRIFDSGVASLRFFTTETNRIVISSCLLLHHFSSLLVAKAPGLKGNISYITKWNEEPQQSNPIELTGAQSYSYCTY